MGGGAEGRRARGRGAVGPWGGREESFVRGTREHKSMAQRNKLLHLQAYNLKSIKGFDLRK
jgi:hypothetical protein